MAIKLSPGFHTFALAAFQFPHVTFLCSFFRTSFVIIQLKCSLYIASPYMNDKTLGDKHSSSKKVLEHKECECRVLTGPFAWLKTL